MTNPQNTNEETLKAHSYLGEERRGIPIPITFSAESWKYVLISRFYSFHLRAGEASISLTWPAIIVYGTIFYSFVIVN